MIAAWLRQPCHMQVYNKGPKQQQFCGFHGAYDPGYTGLEATTWVCLSTRIIAK